MDWKIIKCLLVLLVTVSGMHSNAENGSRALEAFSISELKIQSIEHRGDCGWFAYIKDPNGMLHLVTVGEYLGKDHGVIESINGSGIHVSEFIPDGAGSWRERKKKMELEK
jgi:type IV pilus assembly protein PilP